jgi:SAM-dependent methyltransferase
MQRKAIMRNAWSDSRGTQWLRRIAGALERARMSPEEHYVRMAYRVLLRREIDPSGLLAWRDVVASGRFHQQHVIDTLLASEEYLTRFGIDLTAIQHRSRQEWIRTLAPFDRILDIGGSSPNRPEGALIELGYPHRPSRLDILDRPPDLQYWGKPKYDQSVSAQFDWGTVSYFHGSGEKVAEIPALQEREYDCVFLGQAIEHIYPESLPAMLGWARTHLAPGGRLIFDTPNRLLTKIQCPGSFIDPDHKYEYAPAELERVVADAGFSVTRKVGMVHLPVQAASGHYDPREFAEAPLLSDDVDACYLFALEASAR